MIVDTADEVMIRQLLRSKRVVDPRQVPLLPCVGLWRRSAFIGCTLHQAHVQEAGVDFSVRLSSRKGTGDVRTCKRTVAQALKMRSASGLASVLAGVLRMERANLLWVVGRESLRARGAEQEGCAHMKFSSSSRFSRSVRIWSALAVKSRGMILLRNSFRVVTMRPLCWMERGPSCANISKGSTHMCAEKL